MVAADPDDVDRISAAAAAVLSARMDGIEQVSAVMRGYLDRIWPVEVEKLVAAAVALHDRDVATVNLRFAERDLRFDQAAANSQRAIEAAMSAAAALAAQQAESNHRAAAKVEASTNKQIEAIQAAMVQTFASTDSKINDLKERFAIGEGADKGKQALIATAVAIIGVILAVAAIVVSIVVGRI